MACGSTRRPREPEAHLRGSRRCEAAATAGQARGRRGWRRPGGRARARAARRAAARLATAARLVVLSRGLNYPTAHELALKLKELALLEAEALSGADFRHGPIALAGPKLPAIVVSPPGTATEARCQGDEF